MSQAAAAIVVANASTWRHPCNSGAGLVAGEGTISPVLEKLRTARRRAVGTKETLKAVQNGQAQVVFLAMDADEHVLGPLRAAVQKRSVQVCDVESMKHLGRACGIEVGAAAAALLVE